MEWVQDSSSVIRFTFTWEGVVLILGDQIFKYIQGTGDEGRRTRTMYALRSREHSSYLQKIAEFVGRRGMFLLNRRLVNYEPSSSLLCLLSSLDMNPPTARGAWSGIRARPTSRLLRDDTEAAWSGSSDAADTGRPSTTIPAFSPSAAASPAAFISGETTAKQLFERGLLFPNTFTHINLGHWTSPTTAAHVFDWLQRSRAAESTVEVVSVFEDPSAVAGPSADREESPGPVRFRSFRPGRILYLGVFVSQEAGLSEPEAPGLSEPVGGVVGPRVDNSGLSEPVGGVVGRLGGNSCSARLGLAGAGSFAFAGRAMPAL